MRDSQIIRLTYSISQEIRTRPRCAPPRRGPAIVFTHIHQGRSAGTGTIVRLSQCQRSKPDEHGKISQCTTTTKHSKAKTARTPPGTYCTHLQTHASETRCAHIYWFARMGIPSTQFSTGVHIHTCAIEATHTKEITQICTNAQIYAHPYTHIYIYIYIYIYIQPFMCDGVYIKLNNPDPHTKWHCPGINPIIQCNVPGPVRNQSDASSVGSVPGRSRFSVTLQGRSLLSPIRIDRLLNQEDHRQQINTDLNNGACHRLVSHYSSQSLLRCFVNQFRGHPGCPKYIVIHILIRNNHIR